MAGAVAGSVEVIDMLPRLEGRKLQTEGVIASYLCSGEPNASNDSGCTCHSMLADAWLESLLANAPSWEGGIVIGPVLLKKYSRPIFAIPQGYFALRFRVTVLSTE